MAHQAYLRVRTGPSRIGDACSLPPRCSSPAARSGGSVAERGVGRPAPRAAPERLRRRWPVLRAEAELARLRGPRLPVRHDEGAAGLRASRATGDIKLAVSRKKATGPGKRLGSLLVNPGGPGGSAIGYLQGYAGIGYPAPVRARYDMVAVDPRGVARSEPVECLTGQGDGRVHADGPDPGRRGGESRSSVAAYKKFAQGCEQRARRAARRTSPPSRRPATWTSCARCWATRS